MSDRADSHIHLFEGGYRGSFTDRPGVNVDEPACYASLAEAHNVKAALVVAYAEADWCRTNNAYLQKLASKLKWVRPVAFYDHPGQLEVDRLERHWQEGFVGVSLYVFAPEHVASLAKVPAEVWQWLINHRWMISVNSQGESWSGWLKVLERFGELRMLISHLGLPPTAARKLDKHTAAEQMAHQLMLGRFPGVCMKLSGFYAITDPGYDYPHELAWPYVEAAIDHFGTKRLLWASDFSPCLDNLSFPQTVGLFAKMPFLNDADRTLIEGRNLLDLLEGVR